MDLGGKVLLKHMYTGKALIYTGELTPGTYLVVNEGKNLVIRQKLIML